MKHRAVRQIGKHDWPTGHTALSQAAAEICFDIMNKLATYSLFREVLIGP